MPMTPTLSKRQERILLTLNTHADWVKGADLSHVLGVSDRTVRADIETIKSILGETIILTSKHSGYRLNPEIDFASLSIAQYSDAQERLALILKQLILKTDGIDLYDMANEVMVSESTILTDIQQLRKFVASQGSGLMIDRHMDTLILKGKRFNKMQSLIRWIKDTLSYSTPEQFQRLFPGMDVQSIYDLLLEQLVEEKYFSRYLSFRALLITVLLIVEQSLTGGDDQGTELQQSAESSLVVKILQRIEEVLGVRVMTQDIALLNETLSSVKAMEEVKEVMSSTNLSADQVFRDIRVILGEVKQQYELDFTHETELAVDLTTHVKVAMMRMIKGIHISNPIIEQMKRDYPFLFDIALFIGHRLSEVTGMTFPQDEISFIVCHLAETYENLQRKTVQEKLRILLIALEGKSVAKYIVMTNEVLRQEGVIDLTVISSDMELEAITEHHVTHDLIISTSTIKINSRLPDLIIQPGVSVGDRFSVRAVINRELDVLRKRNFNTLTRLFFSRSPFFDRMAVSDPEQCIKAVCAVLRERGIIDQSFEPSVLERERLISTSIQTGIALPHATIVHAQKTSVAVVTLREPIEWGNQKVTVVLLFAIAQEELKYLNYFYAMISRFAMDPSNVQRLSQCPNLDSVIALFYDVYLKHFQ